MNNVDNAFDKALRSIQEGGSFAIGNAIASDVKKILTELKKNTNEARKTGDIDRCHRLTIDAIEAINYDMASMLTALDMVDVATIKFLKDIESAINSIDTRIERQ